MNTFAALQIGLFEKYEAEARRNQARVFAIDAAAKWWELSDRIDKQLSRGEISKTDACDRLRRKADALARSFFGELRRLHPRKHPGCPSWQIDVWFQDAGLWEALNRKVEALFPPITEERIRELVQKWACERAAHEAAQ